MKIITKTIGIFLALTVALSAMLVPASASAAEIKTKKRTVYLEEYTVYSLPGEGNPGYRVKISDRNKKYIKTKIDVTGDGELGFLYGVYVTAKKQTPVGKPAKFSVYYKKNGKKVSVLKGTVTVRGTEPRVQKFMDVELNPGTLKIAKSFDLHYAKVEERISDPTVIEKDFNDPFTTTDIYNADYSDRGYIKGLKEGTATVSYWIKNGKYKVGEYKVTVKDIPTTIKNMYIGKKRTDVKLNLSDKKSFYTSLVLENYHAGAVYTTEIEKPELLTAKTVKSGKVSPNTCEKLTAVKAGTTKVTIFETREGQEKTEIGTITVKISNKNK